MPPWRRRGVVCGLYRHTVTVCWAGMHSFGRSFISPHLWRTRVLPASHPGPTGLTVCGGCNGTGAGGWNTWADSGSTGPPMSQHTAAAPQLHAACAAHRQGVREAVGCGHAPAEEGQQAGTQRHARRRPPLLQALGSMHTAVAAHCVAGGAEAALPQIAEPSKMTPCLEHVRTARAVLQKHTSSGRLSSSAVPWNSSYSGSTTAGSSRSTAGTDQGISYIHGISQGAAWDDGQLKQQRHRGRVLQDCCECKLCGKCSGICVRPARSAEIRATGITAR